ncbi:7902_t:CDS:2 [Scutellospora calospora]|uniref:7902_t:CDS:1 n=1 Tax=Scutellospora calospora TaxID=85575 RepID=A0ACA9KLL0_9GLOM|nr:7902_t:CDS:2 [Scutellospora calospora]
MNSNEQDKIKQFDSLSSQSLLKKILEDRSYTLYNDNKHVYCHSCQKSITLHYFNDGTRLKEHIITSMHLENSPKTESKKMHTTFLTIFFSNNNNNTLTVIDLTKPNEELNNLVTVTVNDNQLTSSTNQVSKIKQHNSSKHIMQLLLECAEGYFKSAKCLGNCSNKWCYKYSLLSKNEVFNKRNREYQELLAQIDCAMILNIKRELTDSICCKYSQSNHSFKELDTLIKNQEKRSKKYCSNNLDNLFKYYKKEIINSKYQQLVKKYLALGGLLEAVEEHEIED